ncbi:hypothetical protein Q5M86_04005, partial [Brachyspira innocens]|nr:hypothetical protein [Brachyspira innocens]
LFDKLFNKSIEFYKAHNTQNTLSLYKSMEYNTDLLKLLFENRAEYKNAYEALENILDDNKLKAIKPSIEKIKLYSFEKSIDNLNSKTICIEYEAEDAVIIDNIHDDKVYGKNAKFITKDDDIKYESLLYIFASEENNILKAILLKSPSIKAIYFSNDFDDEDIEIIKRIINNDNIKLYKSDN